MQKDQLHILPEFFSEAQSSIKLYIGILPGIELIEECSRNIKRRIAVDICLSESIIEQIEGQPFMLNKLYRIREAGASIYTTSGFNDRINFICQIDFCRTLEMNNDKHEAIYFKRGEPEFNAFQDLFDQIDQRNVEFREEQDDIKIQFTVDSQNVIENTATRIHWEVRNADKVKIDGIGEVSAQGTKTVTILDNTIVNISASNSRQVKIKTLAINTMKQLHIDYDVQFFNPASKQFVSLKEENSTGVFGVTKGNKIKLVWNAREADEVEIKPFDLTEKSGEYVFYPDDAMEINIQARLQGDLKNRRIIIHEFPMPVFSHKITAIDDKFLPEIEFKIRDLRPQAIEFLAGKPDLHYDKFTSEMRKKATSLENKLLSKYAEMSFEGFYENHSISRLNDKIMGRLKSYFKSKPSILSLINSYRNPHE